MSEEISVPAPKKIMGVTLGIFLLAILVLSLPVFLKGRNAQALYWSLSYNLAQTDIYSAESQRGVRLSAPALKHHGKKAAEHAAKKEKYNPHFNPVPSSRGSRIFKSLLSILTKPEWPVV